MRRVVRALTFLEIIPLKLCVVLATREARQNMNLEMAQPQIQRMAEKLVQASGASYQIAYEMFRFYVRDLDFDSFKSEIDRVTDPGIFRVLLSVGMSDEKQDVARKQLHGYETENNGF